MTFVKLSGAAGNVNNKTGVLDTGPRALAPNVGGATMRLDCTSGVLATPFQGFANPFNDPADIVILTTFFSWDGGATFPESASTHANGSPTGTWGKGGVGNMAPMFGRGVPSNTQLGGRPNAYRGTISVVGGPITFGISVEEYDLNGNPL